MSKVIQFRDACEEMYMDDRLSYTQWSYINSATRAYEHKKQDRAMKQRRARKEKRMAKQAAASLRGESHG